MIFRELVAGTNGMDGAEAVRQKEQCGPNRLPEPPPRGPLISLLANLHNLLMHLLFGAVLLAVPTLVALRKWRPKHDGRRGSWTGSAAG
jgi:hypothetical protein